MNKNQFYPILFVRIKQLQIVASQFCLHHPLSCMCTHTLIMLIQWDNLHTASKVKSERRRFLFLGLSSCALHAFPSIFHKLFVQAVDISLACQRWASKSRTSRWFFKVSLQGKKDFFAHRQLHALQKLPNCSRSFFKGLVFLVVGVIFTAWKICTRRKSDLFSLLVWQELHHLWVSWPHKYKVGNKPQLVVTLRKLQGIKGQKNLEFSAGVSRILCSL